MPFKSQAQRAYLCKRKKKVCEEFAEKTPKGKKLPKRAPKNKRR